MLQPLFPHDDDAADDPAKNEEYVLRRRHSQRLEPLHKGLVPPSPAQHHYTPTKHPKADPAVTLIRGKVEAAYAHEPSAEQELREATTVPKPLSKHQAFMYKLSTSGKPLAQIHNEWHSYYASLPDDEKHQVWREFYENSARSPSAYTQYTQQKPVPHTTAFGEQRDAYKPVVADLTPPTLPHTDRRSPRTIKRQIVRKVAANAVASERAKQHARSVLFGISTGATVLVVLLFGLFNQMIVAPFIEPSHYVSNTPIILSTDSIAASDTPEVIIPKINVQIPVVYDPNSVNEAAIEQDLESGVAHYSTTVMPGQKGNTAFFGHSSNNIFNPGKYKFAFVLLHTLVPGDTFYLTYNKQIYTYQVYERQIVAPEDVSVLNNVPGKIATATLITCDPPGTSNNRLVVWGEQISPDPSADAQATPTATPQTTPKTLPNEGPSLWDRLLQDL